MPHIMALVVLVKSGLDGVRLVSCSGVQNLTSISRFNFIVSTVGVFVVKLLVEEEGLVL